MTMTAFTPDENAPLLIEITPTAGVQEVALTPDQMAAKADEVMTKVMNAIHGVSARFSDLYANLPDQFTQVELSFGVKVTSEMGALIAKAGIESTFNVKLVWQKK
jgi:hypothetical protein